MKKPAKYSLQAFFGFCVTFKKTTSHNNKESAN